MPTFNPKQTGSELFALVWRNRKCDWLENGVWHRQDLQTKMLFCRTFWNSNCFHFIALQSEGPNPRHSFQLHFDTFSYSNSKQLNSVPWRKWGLPTPFWPPEHASIFTKFCTHVKAAKNFLWWRNENSTVRNGQQTSEGYLGVEGRRDVIAGVWRGQQVSAWDCMRLEGSAWITGHRQAAVTSALSHQCCLMLYLFNIYL